MIVVEVGIKLNNDLEYYDRILRDNGLNNDFNCVTHDIYYTKENLDGLTENEMKKKCVRLRNVNNGKYYKIENYPFDDLKKNEIKSRKISKFENSLIEKGFKKVFDTTKKDHHYYKEGMHSRVQLQEIEDIGLLVYFDNKDYYELPLEEQRRKLIDELNGYGFNINYDTLGLDKLRTLYYQKEMYSINQN